MNHVVDMVLTGPLVSWREKIGWPGREAMAGETVPGADLLDPERMGTILDRFAAARPGASRRSVVSAWTQWYFGLVVPPVLALDAFSDHVLPVALDDISVRLDAGGVPVGVLLPHDGAASAEADPFRRLEGLIEKNIAPLVGALFILGRLSPRVLWGNAAHLTEWLIVEFGKSGAPDPAIARQRELIRAPAGLGGERNMLASPVDYELSGDGELTRWRRVCCLAFEMPGSGACANCPRVRPEVPGRVPRRRAQ